MIFVDSLKHHILQRVPITWRYTLATIKNGVIGRWRHHHYSHCGEDVLVHTHFRHQREGFYVDVGAHHPRRYSNTALLYERGWRGINVEPNILVESEFKRLRPRDIHVQCGVGDAESTMEFHVFSDPAVSTFSAENAERLKRKKWLQEVKTIAVPVHTLSTILHQHVPKGVEIDFLNIDIEDLDIHALRSNDWKQFSPRVVAVEDRLFDFRNPEQSKIHSFMSTLQYVLVAQMGLTLIYMRSDEYARKVSARHE